ncbi:MAG: SpoIIE family protein phosphatase [Bacteriovoracaceae bacterium]|nr:SpoIIE family protein phosphatase [Bacteriovoracaceae bacterium]
MTQKLGIPLKVKVIVLISIILGSSLVFFTSFSVDLFKKDKAAYVYETSLVTSESIQSQVDQYLSKSIKMILLIKKIIEKRSDNQIQRQIFLEHEGSLLFVSKNFTIENKNSLKSLSLKSSDLKNFDFNSTPPIATSSNKIELRLFKIGSQEVFHLLETQSRMQLFFSTNYVISPLEENKIYSSFLFSSRSSFVFPSKKNLPELVAVSNQLKENPISKSVKEINIGNEKYLLAWSRLRSLNLYVVSLIQHKKAFKAATYLTQKSLYFGMMVLGIGMILAVFFSRSLTKPLETLYQGTQKIASGDFTGKVDVSSRDEIGSLSNSFNYMSSEILRYMEEMKEKARLENEIAVAKLVQDSFFPAMEHKFENLEVAAFYNPASECGGDWFQVHRESGKTIILIADATGHGVPAAFLTATIHSAFNSIMDDPNTKAQALSDSGVLLEKINRVVCKMQTNLYLTCIALIIDEATNQMNYTNASHMDPFIIHQKQDEYNKQDLIPLLDGKGPRLGHKLESSFNSSTHKLKAGDTLILMTDGILESVNNEEKQYGQRNFIKSLCSNLHSDPAPLRDNIISDLKNFCGSTPFDDDVTLMVLRT